MAVTPQEAFKLGFMRQCVLRGMTPDQMLSVAKQAEAMVDSGTEKKAFIGSALSSLTDAAKGLAGYAVPAALIAPPVLGAAAGYGLAKATDVDDTDVADVQNQELVSELRRQAEELRRQRAVRLFRQQRNHTGRVFM